MAFCKNCGSQLPEGAAACPNCGTLVNGQPANNGQQIPPYNAQQVPPYNAQQVPPYNAQQVPPYNAQAPITGDADVQANKGMSVLSYFGILLLIPLFARKDSDYCRFHVRQGFSLAVCEIAYTIVTQIILAIIGAIFKPTITYTIIGAYYAPSGIYTAFSIVFGLANILFVVCSIIGIVNAAKGQRKEVPLFGKITFLTDLADKIIAAVNKK